MGSRRSSAGARAQLIRELREAIRQHSTMAVLFHASVAERFGLGPTDIKALELIHHTGPLTAGDLVERTGLSSSAVTSLIDRLEERGFTRRVRDEDDRRRVIVEIVPERARHVAAPFGGVAAAADELWEAYSLEQLQLIVDFLRRTTAFLSRRIESRSG
jgi:DNA-binding MarR family transcriptional regulator